MSTTALEALKEKMKQELERVKRSVPAPSGRTISTKGKVFTLPDGQSNQGPLEAVILDYRNFYRYYTKPYDPQNPTPPGCFAIGKDLLNDMAPHDEAMDPQAESCGTCPMNEWGSAPTGRGKACRNGVRLAIVPATATADDEPMVLVVSPTGIRSWSSFVNGLQVHGKLPIEVVASIAFDPNAAYPTLTFKPIEAHDKLEVMWALREKAQVLLDQPPAV